MTAFVLPQFRYGSLSHMISGRRHFNDWVYWTQKRAFRIVYMIVHCFLKSYWINIDVFQIIYGILKVQHLKFILVSTGVLQLVCKNLLKIVRLNIISSLTRYMALSVGNISGSKINKHDMNKPEKFFIFFVKDFIYKYLYYPIASIFQSYF